MKPVPTDRDFLIRWICEGYTFRNQKYLEVLNSTQTQYLIDKGYILYDGFLTEKGLKLAYGELGETNS